MIGFWLCFLLLHGFSSAQFGFHGVFPDGLSLQCVEVFNSSSLLVKAKMLDASSKLITSGLLEGNTVDLGDFDECLSIEDESNNIYGKYCLATVDINKYFSALNSAEGNAISPLLHQTQTKMDKYANEIYLLGELYTAVAKFGICIPDKCTPKNIEFLKIDEAKCSTKFTNNEMDVFPFAALVILYVIIFIAVVSTFYDIIIQKLWMKPKHPILIAFSLYTNGKKLLTTQTTPDQLSCLDGLKVLSMIWVVLGHSYLKMFETPVDNILYVIDWADNLASMLVLSGTLSVDTFFVIGGLLTVYVSMKSPPIEPKEGLKRIPMSYLHRYLRLTPAFAMMVLIYASGLLRYVGDGPRWYTLDTEIEKCKKHWWAALLYVQNYYSEMCVPQTWYLAVDFQLFLITPFLLIPLRKWPRYVMPAWFSLAALGVIIPFLIGYTNKYGGVGLGEAKPGFGPKYYFVTYAIFAPYIIGMIAGYYIHKAKKGSRLFKLETWSVVFLWLLVLTGIVGCIFDGFKLVKHYDYDEALIDGVYMGLNRSLWALSISLLIFLCSTGYGGPIQKFLSLPVFNVTAKLTYSMYLVHYIVITCVNGASRTKLHFSNFSIVSYFFTYFILTLVISVFFSLLFESPMITVEKIIFPTTAKSRENEKLPR